MCVCICMCVFIVCIYVYCSFQKKICLQSSTLYCLPKQLIIYYCSLIYFRLMCHKVKVIIFFFSKLRFNILLLSIFYFISSLYFILKHIFKVKIKTCIQVYYINNIIHLAISILLFLFINVCIYVCFIDMYNN